MARINIEEDFWMEITSLIAKMGDQDKAIGNAVRWFRFAQQKHKQGKFISEQEFKDNGFDESLFPIFATRVEGGIQAVGAEKHFGWLAKRVEAGRKGGQKSAEIRNSGEANPSKTEQIQANSSNLEQAEPSPSPSFSDSKEKINKKEIEDDEKIKFESLWQAYPKKVNKLEGFKRLHEQVKDLPRITKSFENYLRFLRLEWNLWRHPKDFDVFIGPASKKIKYWHEWENPDPSVYDPPKGWKSPQSHGGNIDAVWLQELELYRKAASKMDRAQGGDFNSPIIRAILGDDDRVEIFYRIGARRFWEMGNSENDRKTMAGLIKQHTQEIVEACQ